MKTGKVFAKHVSLALFKLNLATYVVNHIALEATVLIQYMLMVAINHTLLEHTI